jgi:hypothetical protein
MEITSCRLGPNHHTETRNQKVETSSHETRNPKVETLCRFDCACVHRECGRKCRHHSHECNAHTHTHHNTPLHARARAHTHTHTQIHGHKHTGRHRKRCIVRMVMSSHSLQMEHSACGISLTHTHSHTHMHTHTHTDAEAQDPSCPPLSPSTSFLYPPPPSRLPSLRAHSSTSSKPDLCIRAHLRQSRQSDPGTHTHNGKGRVGAEGEREELRGTSGEMQAVVNQGSKPFTSFCM